MGIRLAKDEDSSRDGSEVTSSVDVGDCAIAVFVGEGEGVTIFSNMVGGGSDPTFSSTGFPVVGGIPTFGGWPEQPISVPTIVKLKAKERGKIRKTAGAFFIVHSSRDRIGIEWEGYTPLKYRWHASSCPSALLCPEDGFHAKSRLSFYLGNDCPIVRMNLWKGLHSMDGRPFFNQVGKDLLSQHFSNQSWLSYFSLRNWFALSDSPTVKSCCSKWI
jgi:hypothetical protein